LYIKHQREYISFHKVYVNICSKDFGHLFDGFLSCQHFGLLLHHNAQNTIVTLAIFSFSSSSNMSTPLPQTHCQTRYIYVLYVIPLMLGKPLSQWCNRKNNVTRSPYLQKYGHLLSSWTPFCINVLLIDKQLRKQRHINSLTYYWICIFQRLLQLPSTLRWLLLVRVHLLFFSRLCMWIMIFSCFFFLWS
jgi:hypothetical protein